MKIVSIVGARPQFIKLAPFNRAIKKHNQSQTKIKLEHKIIHTGQHYDYEMDKMFFEELFIPVPDYNLGVGSGNHGRQTGEMIKKIEAVLLKEKPLWVLVYGDTNSTLAGAIAATKQHFLLAHIEAGLRSYNKKMPEENNRILTDFCSDILFCPTENAVKNLYKEGFRNILNKGKLINLTSQLSSINNYPFPLVINAGDVMYDLLKMSLQIAENKPSILKKLKLNPKEYYLATVHRAENTDDKAKLQSLMDSFLSISKKKPIVFPLHPRTKKMLEPIDFTFFRQNRLYMIDPVSYFQMLIIEKNASLIFTDSGGIQKEAFMLDIPCITLRNETEWIETMENGWNILGGIEKEKLIKTFHDTIAAEKSRREKKCVFGIGRSAELILSVLNRYGT